MLLGVNIDHVATLRNARGGAEPDVIKAAEICEANGATSITTHLREDRRHIKDKDVYTLIKTIKTNRIKDSIYTLKKPLISKNRGSVFYHSKASFDMPCPRKKAGGNN